MIVQMLTHTPVWVIALFFGLISVGYLQSKDRHVSAKRLVIVPLVMLTLSFIAVWNTFGFIGLGLACWIAAAAFAVLLCQLMGPIDGIAYSTESRRFHLPGSWVLLSLMLAIFATRYVVAASPALNPGLRSVPVFIGATGWAYGLWSGIFLGRMIQILSVRHRQVQSDLHLA